MRRFISSILGLALVPLALPAAILVRGHWRPKNRWGNFDVIAVLGTAQYDGVPSKQFAARLRWAAELWEQQQTQQVVTLGANLPGDRFTEAHVGGQYLIAAHVEPHLITELSEGNDTRSSLEALGQRFPDKSVLLVTDPNHVLRAQLLARTLGIRAVATGTPYTPSTFPSKAWALTLMHECGGLLALAARAIAGERAEVVEDLLREVEIRLRPSRGRRVEFLRRH
ncbi:YdcF family protein [Corynebacterium sp. SCR221107]|uniref:YdcF family protein n=1 Tax=Corynebacterium sp. SCR221107 TaxID=3017361 RepID=UPI0022EC5942|nr:YdcF family protein [Corynebacterium sp. SCR221107]WBT08129.1 YdcF family protein [Corynebacterium sp. SCR221107]